MIENIILINLFFVLALDVAGFWRDFSAMLKGWLTNGKMKEPFDLKPFSCSLCCTFWVSLIYIIIAGFDLKMVIFALGLAVLSPVTASVINFVKNLMLRFIDIVAGWLKI